MKAISLWQPWASAIALGLKRIETRSFYPAYRGEIAIHAAKRRSREQEEMFLQFSGHPKFLQAMTVAGYHTFGALPFGAVVAVARLIWCERTSLRETQSLPDIERMLGDFSCWRFCWCLDDIRPLRSAFPAVGRQGFFDVPDDIAANALPAV